MGAGLVLSVFLVLTGWTLDRAFEDSARSAMLERLRGQLFLLLGETDVSDNGDIRLPAQSALTRLNQPDSGLYAAIYGNGQKIWQSRSIITDQPAFIATLGAGEESFQHLDKSFVFSYGIEWQTAKRTIPLTLSLSEDTTAFSAQVNTYRKTLWGWLGGMALLLLMVQLAVLRWGLRPLRMVAHELRSIEQGQQDKLKADYPNELRGLTGNLNTLLAHEHAQQQRYRNALADLAHSLKTPLAVLQGAAHEPGTVREQIDRMQQTVDYQLQRAATAGRSSLSAPQQLLPLVESLSHALQKVHAGKSIDMQVNVKHNLSLRADKGDLTELLGNLLDNACKWCKTSVWLEARHDDAGTHICINDDGPGFPDGQVDAILKRGVRADQSVPGHGIGLAMVRDIVDAYQGLLTIGTNSDNGAQVCITIPDQ